MKGKITMNKQQISLVVLVGALMLGGGTACSTNQQTGQNSTVNNSATSNSTANNSANNQPQGSPTIAQQANPIDWKRVDEAMGRKGTMMPGDVYRFSMPRSDLKVTVKGVEIKPAFALGSWAAFKQMPDGQVMAMGDTVMTEDEISPVMLKLQQSDIGQSALHHHLLYENPRIYYMHLMATGDPVKIAETIKSALDLTKTPSQSAAPTTATGNGAESGNPSGTAAVTPANNQTADIGIDTAQIDSIVGFKGKVNGGVYQISVPRAHKITEMGMEIPPSMGVTTAINFQPTGNGKAAITGDFVMTGDEVNNVIRALRENGIEVTALHNHSLNDEPRIFYMHFWANDDAVKLARGLRAALDKTNSQKAQAQ
jgi:hypothetical protein